MAYENLRRVAERRAAVEQKAAVAKAGQSSKASQRSGTPNFAPLLCHIAGDLERAAANAVKAERTRIAAVFNSPDSRGRERVCATLLTAGDWSAATICAQLEHTPTDAQVDREARSASSQTQKDKILAAQARALGKTTDDPWAKIYQQGRAK